MRVLLRSAQRELSKVLQVVDHEIREGPAEFEDRIMSFSTKQAYVRPFKVTHGPHSKVCLSRDGLVVVEEPVYKRALSGEFDLQNRLFARDFNIQLFALKPQFLLLMKKLLL
jgi:hypothetical protein